MPTQTLQTLTIAPGKLSGRVTLSGAKNSVLRLMAASLLTDEPVVLQRYPAGLLDARVHCGMLEALGKECVQSGDDLTIRAGADSLAPDLVWPGRTIRNTLLILGALVARFGYASVPLPGGCDLGGRGWDLHKLVLGRLGAEVTLEDDRLVARAPNGLKGAEIELPLRSTGATENALIAGALARGRTRVWNPHIRPEIIDLARFLTAMGAQVRVNGTESIEIEGVPKLGGLTWPVMPDNMEALTWAIGAAISGGELEIANFPVEDLEVPLIFLRASGVSLAQEGNIVRARADRCFPVEIATGPYPGINSDMQPLFAALGAVAKGVSHIVDLRFPNRYAYLDAFTAMGVDCSVDQGRAIIRGGGPIIGARVQAPDIRAGAALALLALAGTGPTQITDAWQIQRGYDGIVAKLRAMGIDCQEELS